MTRDEMQMQIDVLVGQGRVIELLDIATMINGFESAESVGPLIDPSAFVANPGKFDELAATKEFLQGARAFQVAYVKYKEFCLTRKPA